MTVLLSLEDEEFRVLALHLGCPNPRLVRWLIANEELSAVTLNLKLKVTETSLTLAHENLDRLEGEERDTARLQLGRDNAHVDQIRAAMAEEGAT